MADGIEALADIRVEDIARLARNHREDGFDGVVGGASGSEPVGVSLEAGFPFRFQGEECESLFGPDAEGGNPQGTRLPRTRLGDADPAEGRRLLAESELSGQLQASGGGKIAHPIHARRALPAIILGHFADRQEASRLGRDQEPLELAKLFDVATQRGSVNPLLQPEDRGLDGTPVDGRPVGPQGLASI